MQPLIVCDLFAGGGGYTAGAVQAGAKVVLAVEADKDIARVHLANFPDHEVRVQTLGGDSDALVEELVSLGRERLMLHGSPPCTRLCQVNQKNRDTTEGLRLVRWYLDLVARVQPRFWSMEQVPHAQLKALLHERNVPFTVIDAADFDCPQHRKRLIAGSACIIAALEAKRGTGPTVLPKDVLASLQPAARFMLRSGTTNQPVKVYRDGVRTTAGYRRMRDDEGARDLHSVAHTVWSKPGRVVDGVSGQIVRRLTPSECALLQGCRPGFQLDERSIGRSYKIVGNMIPPPVAKAIVRAAMASISKGEA